MAELLDDLGEDGTDLPAVVAAGRWEAPLRIDADHLVLAALGDVPLLQVEAEGLPLSLVRRAEALTREAAPAASSRRPHRSRTPPASGAVFLARAALGGPGGLPEPVAPADADRLLVLLLADAGIEPGGGSPPRCRTCPVRGQHDRRGSRRSCRATGGAPGRTSELGGHQRLEVHRRVPLLEHPQRPLVGEHRQQVAVVPLQHLGAVRGRDVRDRAASVRTARLYGSRSRAMGALNSCSIRWLATSNCIGPTTASTGAWSPRRSERSTWTTPSESSCSMPLRNCLCLAVSLPRATAKCSGANVVIGGR